MAKAFSIEDGNLSNRPITSSASKVHSDIDCAFEPNRQSDIFKKTDASAVRQSVKNLLLTTPGEKPFDPYFGTRLGSMLFDLSTDIDEDDIRAEILQAINTYEPRVNVNLVDIKINEDNYSVDIRVVVQVINTLTTVTIPVTITRNR